MQPAVICLQHQSAEAAPAVALVTLRLSNSLSVAADLSDAFTAAACTY
jgi:hypothetical protein